jgi:RNA polymerase sigma-70 factor, ECF subfamily
LPERERAAMTLVYDEGLSAAETARILGASAKAVERLLARERAFESACKLFCRKGNPDDVDA